MAVVLIAMGGAVVDYVRVDSARKEAQLALDATALALQPDIYKKKPADIQALAQAYLTNRMNDTSITAVVDTVTADTNAGTLSLHAQVTLPMTFIQLVGINSMTVSLLSEANRKLKNLEVVFVLDNSGSMSRDDRMNNLKSAAVCATNYIFHGACTPGASAPSVANVKAGVVPFNIFVNVDPRNANAAWMDQNGNSSIANDNFDNDDNAQTPFAGPVNRFALYNAMPKVSWQGCVETRPYPLSVNDTPPDASNPDTLFVPEFAPDEPDSGWDGGFYNNYISDDSKACKTKANKLSDRERQERLCKYQGASLANGVPGPNANCVNTAIQPLTSNANLVVSRIGNMVARGGTNIQAGTIWGMRVLSPTPPFTEGLPYDKDTSKVMIIMTDGQNTYYASNNMNGSAYYYPFGHLWNTWQDANRIGTSSLTTSGQVANRIDQMTLESCTAAKNEGIEVYTIGLSPPSQSTVDLLTACATNAEHAYFPTDPQQLHSVFSEIAQKLVQLRLQR